MKMKILTKNMSVFLAVLLLPLAALAAPEGTLTATPPVETANQIVQIGQAFGVKPWLLLAQMINFCLVAGVLYFFVIKPIQGQLDVRAKLIDEGLKRSEESARVLAAAEAQKAEMIASARREAQAMVEKTQKEMQTWEASRRTQAQQEAALIAETAARNLSLDQRQQVERAERELTSLVVTVAEKALEESLTAEQKTKFAQRMNERMPAILQKI